MKESPYWNPVLETLSRDELTHFELQRFRNVLARAMQFSSMYTEKFRDVGVVPEDIQNVDDLRQLPLTEKAELRQAQEADGDHLYGQTLMADGTSPSVLHQTSGTTGRPVYVPDSYRSWQWRIEPWTCMLYMMGFRETDRVFIPFGYNVYVAFWSGHYAAEKLGCEVVPGGALDTKARILKMKEVGATALFNTPTYGVHLAETAKDMGIDPAKDLSIRKMVCAGEPLPEATRRKLESLWNADVYNHIGGAETCGWAGMCREKKDLHVLEPYFLLELLDKDTMRHHVLPAEEGVAVITPLFYRSFPLIRYNTRDLMTLARGECACGRTSMRIARIGGRTDDLKKVRGVLFSPRTVEELLAESYPEIVEYEILLTRPGDMDEIRLRLESDPEVGTDGQNEIGARLRHDLKVKTNLRFDLEWAKKGNLPRYTLKAKRFKDLREQGGAHE
jgi:phenylacetate-CoA ligase